VAYLTGSQEFDAGIVISASHNPFEDNGIKVFTGDGEKFDEGLEAHIEDVVADTAWQVGPPVGPPAQQRDLIPAYIAHARTALTDPATLGGSRIAIDCANGATTTVAPRLFRELGFDVTVVGGQPDGRNINLRCGSTHPELLAAAVKDGGFRLGVAFDGDGDRAILVDHHGNLVDGDAVLLLCARHFKARGELRGNAVVATVMSNIGLEIGLQALGIELVRTPVGDKYVAEVIADRRLSLGGEQSGHVIFSEFLFTGDGIVTALNVLRVMAESGRELADLAADYVRYPQILVNVRVRERQDYTQVPGIARVIADTERQLSGRGRLLVRYSGTEPLLRIMIEGQDQAAIDRWAHDIADEVRTHLG
jgi:phosphoglucosamine mutase